MPLYPLCSGLHLGEEDGQTVTRSSNAPVAALFKVVKKEVLVSSKNLRIGAFGRKLRLVIKGRLKKLLYLRTSTFQKAMTATPRKKRKHKSDEANAEEVWKRRSIGKSRTS